ncbi:MAG: DUF3800 domain-containing protein [Candidatus Bipolaricaulota bacterium]|nr:DUF3800 domain-containing protein [Candidatus Bipolaricaulota bacterium]MCS7274011.1 DUF3800 domain-containing protein [Candidatus Bipolaricaulota bacterium]MDW8111364.1 DUF3800 domain-containing protein [Candidatus Bipolaricaulota bacterium]MDW8329898.1 DUF3800 domain-containing protein [Candidatus Bipolaricaulota bacterium]
MYLFYLDESGEREYESRGRYFVLCALGLPVSEWRALNNDVLMLKNTYFRDARVEIKSAWLRIPKEREKRYIHRYHLTEDELNEFVAKLYDALLSYNITIIASVINKEQMQDQYKQPQSPSSLAYRLLFERIELFLESLPDAFGLILFDKITDLQVMKKGYEDLLTQQHLRYLEKGTEFVRVNRIVEGLLFIPSHENNLLQLADLCGYNIYRQFFMYGDEWDAHRRFINRYSYFERIESKLHRSSEGDYAGYGIKKFP